MLFNLSLCVHFVALRIASLGGWSGGGAVGDVWHASQFTCLLGLGGAHWGGLRSFPAKTALDNQSYIQKKEHNFFKKLLQFTSKIYFPLEKKHSPSVPLNNYC